VWLCLPEKIEGVLPLEMVHSCAFLLYVYFRLSCIEGLSAEMGLGLKKTVVGQLSKTEAEWGLTVTVNARCWP